MKKLAMTSTLLVAAMAILALEFAHMTRRATAYGADPPAAVEPANQLPTTQPSTLQQLPAATASTSPTAATNPGSPATAPLSEEATRIKSLPGNLAATTEPTDLASATQPADVETPPRVASTQPIKTVARPVSAIERAVVISIDGLRPDLLLRVNTPNIHKLFQGGSFSFWARTTAVSITLPSHTSMLTGAVPHHHGIEWNRDLPLEKPIFPTVPTLFEMAHRAGYSTAMVTGKSKFTALVMPNTLDWFYVPARKTIEDPVVTDVAVKLIHEHRPQVLFVHFPSDDNAGHKYGWASLEQIKAIEGADVDVGRVLSALDEENLRGSTFILLTADHGGAGRTHGPEDDRSRHIPWIISGPGIRKNLDLTSYPKLTIDTEDTFATVCWLLGIPTDPKNVDGKPITQIIEQGELLQPVK